MADVIEVTRAVEEGSDEEPLTCECDHDFTRSQLDVRSMVYIEDTIDCSLREFDITEYTTTRNECPVCSDCAIENDRIVPTEPQRQWMCKECMAIWDDEQEAVDCCD